MEKLNINTEEVNRETRSKVLLGFLKSAENIKPFNGKKLEDIFSNEEGKREFIRHLTNEDFFSLIIGLNAVLVGKKKEDWEMEDKEVSIGSAIYTVSTPMPEDKPELLEELLSTMKEMNERGDGLKDIAMLVSSSINAIHVFQDGNGRTSRFLYKLLTEDFDSENKDKISAVLLDSGRRYIDINPGLIDDKVDGIIQNMLGYNNPEINPENVINILQSQDNGYLEHDFKVAEIKQEISEKDKKFILHEMYEGNDDRSFFYSVFKLFCDHKDLDRKKFMNVRGEGENMFGNFYADLLIGGLTTENLLEIISNYRNLKKRQVKILMDCISNPDKEEYQIEVDGSKVSLKSYFENRIRQKQENLMV